MNTKMKQIPHINNKPQIRTQVPGIPATVGLAIGAPVAVTVAAPVSPPPLPQSRNTRPKTKVATSTNIRSVIKYPPTSDSFTSQNPLGSYLIGTSHQGWTLLCCSCNPCCLPCRSCIWSCSCSIFSSSCSCCCCSRISCCCESCCYCSCC